MSPATSEYESTINKGSPCFSKLSMSEERMTMGIDFKYIASHVLWQSTPFPGGDAMNMYREAILRYDRLSVRERKSFCRLEDKASEAACRTF